MATSKTLVNILHELIVEIATLKRPVTAAAVAAVIITLIPIAGISATAVAAVLVGVGAVAAFVEKLLNTPPPSA